MKRFEKRLEGMSLIFRGGAFLGEFFVHIEDK